MNFKELRSLNMKYYLATGGLCFSNSLYNKYIFICCRFLPVTVYLSEHISFVDIAFMHPYKPEFNCSSWCKPGLINKLKRECAFILLQSRCYVSVNSMRYHPPPCASSGQIFNISIVFLDHSCPRTTLIPLILINCTFFQHLQDLNC